MKSLETDVLIIGTGIAGCTAALEASDHGLQVTMITRAAEPEDTATRWAQGGIVFKGPGDSPEKLVADIEEAGVGICNRAAAEVLAGEGPMLVEQILMKRLQVPFDLHGGKPDLTVEGAHSLPRIIHSGDHTGKAIEVAFLNHLKGVSNVKILAAHTAIDLLTLAHHSKDPRDAYETPRCIGAFVFDQANSEVSAIFAKETVLATGGLGQLYLNTTNPSGARGDGLAMAYRTGARVMNLEFIQFHPTTLYSKGSDRFLISESLRGEGARLLNLRGEEFMKKYDARGTLAPRDVVCRAIVEEMLREDTRYVYLDITHKPADWVKQRFPSIYEECMKRNRDITKEPIPVVPAAHYSCGGVASDLLGNTTIRNLKAVGEVACTGLHGSNRLASTSLLENLVWGVRAARDIAERLPFSKYRFPQIQPWEYEKESVEVGLINQDWLTIKHTMWNYVGLIRTPKRLERAQRILTALSDEVERFYAHSVLSDDLIGLRNAACSAQLVLTAARRNHQSIGTHFLTPENGRVS